MTTDEEIARRAVTAPEGDVRDFEELVRRHKSKVVANCRYLARGADDAEDLAQEVFLKAYYGLGSYEGRSTFRTWIQRIKVNHCLNHLRKKNRENLVQLDDSGATPDHEPIAPPDAERGLSGDDVRRRIDRILDSMTDTLRIPLVMRDLDEMPYQEIAETLGLGLSAAKMRIKRAREEFQRAYRDAQTDS